ncbi:TetR/AcrR family transcriptional regulator [Halobacterium sp. KA-6]|uniref:TetR/AcrR family transcriptional regulator n=1 Tax=Halobacterium sp. KA-6 TaxID=2896368 RepID=UPI001E2DBA61|nr:TetR/AcrR family transcriptional regulator [Halobacterium sp. KA-6]MCD2205198.1 TetR/AcrR family transcriptional regulator [Halobacterium sp. KA-6]
MTDILEATHRALCRHGYADLTIQDIAAESDKSKATIHYHYGTKEALFSVFLDYLYDQYTAQIDAASGETPLEHLHSLLDILLWDSTDPAKQAFQTAILEIKAQAPYDESVQEQLIEFDAYLSDRLQAVIEAGIQTGEFNDDIDPSTAADFLTTTIKGAHTRQVTVNHPPEHLTVSMANYIQTYLLDDDPTEAPPA